MSSVPVDLVSRRSFYPSFYFWIAFVMAAYVFGGFTLAALERYLANDPRTMPPVVHLHGIVFISWMTLLMVQTWLINVKNVALHRSLGTFGVALGTAVLFTGMLIVALGVSNGPPTAPFYYDLSYLSLAALGGFGTLFTLAMRHVRDPENHRRLILFATIPLLPPGINRTYQVLGQLDYLPVFATYLTMAALAAALVVHDYRKNGELSFASKVGGVIVFGQQVLHFPVTRSETFADVMRFLVGLVYYR
jgi:uncharacterized membrane protein